MRSVDLSRCALPWRQSSAPAPYAGKPGLLFDRQARGTVEVLQLLEAGRRHQGVPSGPVVKHAIALTIPALLPCPARVGAEQHSAPPQTGVQLQQHLSGAHETARHGKHTVEALCGQIELQKALLQHLAAAMCARHRRRTWRGLQAHGTVAHLLEDAQVAPRVTDEIQQVKGRWPSYMLEQRRDALADIVVACLPRSFGRAAHNAQERARRFVESLRNSVSSRIIA